MFVGKKNRQSIFVEDQHVHLKLRVNQIFSSVTTYSLVLLQLASAEPEKNGAELWHVQ